MTDKGKNVFSKALKNFFYDPKDTDLTFENIEDIQIGLRRRAIASQRQAWVFLLLIVFTLGFAVFVTLSLLSSVNSAEGALLSKIHEGEIQQLENVQSRLEKLAPEVKKGKGEISAFMTGIGIEWEDITPPNSAGFLGEIFSQTSPDGYVYYGLSNNFGTTGKLWKSLKPVDRISADEDWQLLGDVTLEYDAKFSFFDDKVLLNDDELSIISDSDTKRYYYNKYTSPFLHPVNLKTENTIGIFGQQDNLFKNSANAHFFKDYVVYENLNPFTKYPFTPKVLVNEHATKKIVELNIRKLIGVEELTFSTYSPFKIIDDKLLFLVSAEEIAEKIVIVDLKAQLNSTNPVLISVPKGMTRAENRTILSTQFGNNQIFRMTYNSSSSNINLSVWNLDTASVIQLNFSKFDITSLETTPSIDCNTIKYIENNGNKSFYSCHLNFKQHNKEEDLYFVLNPLWTEKEKILTPASGYVKTSTNGHFYTVSKKKEIRTFDIVEGESQPLVKAPKIEAGNVITAFPIRDSWMIVQDLDDVHGSDGTVYWNQNPSSGDWSQTTIYHDLKDAYKVMAYKNPKGTTMLLAGIDMKGNPKLFKSSYLTAPSNIIQSPEKNTSLSKVAEFQQYLKVDAPRSIEQFPNYKQLVNNVDSYVTLDERKNYLQTLLDKLDDAPGIGKKPKNKEAAARLTFDPTNAFPLIIFTFAKFLVLAIIFFAVKILVNLYRYFLQLKSYYEARADSLAILLADHEKLKTYMPDKLSELFTSFTPSSIDLGTAPNTPMEGLADIISKLSKSVADLKK